jgi:hypothetical protein
VRDQHRRGHAGADRRDRVPQLDDVRAAADAGVVDPQGLDAHRVRHLDGEVTGGGDPVDVPHRHPGVVQRVPGRLDVQYAAPSGRE